MPLLAGPNYPAADAGPPLEAMPLPPLVRRRFLSPRRRPVLSEVLSAETGTREPLSVISVAAAPFTVETSRTSHIAQTTLNTTRFWNFGAFGSPRIRNVSVPP